MQFTGHKKNYVSCLNTSLVQHAQVDRAGIGFSTEPPASIVASSVAVEHNSPPCSQPLAGSIVGTYIDCQPENHAAEHLPPQVSTTAASEAGSFGQPALSISRDNAAFEVRG